MDPTRSRAPLLCGAVLALLLAACGGGGALPAPEVLPVVDLGLQASTVVSRTELSFPNPLSSPATVTAGAAQGPFELDPLDLPALAPADGSVTLGVLFTPQGDGFVSGVVTLVFAGSSSTVEQRWEVRATGETVTWGVLTPTLDFGAVEVGESADLEASFLNASTFSPVTLTAADLPEDAFSIVGDPFPLVVEPGTLANVTVRYAPTAGVVHDGVLQLGPHDVGGPVTIQLVAEGIGSGKEVVTDYGTVTLDGSDRTPILAVSVPDDAISLYIEGRATGGILQNLIGLDLLTGPGGKVYENSSSTGDFVWMIGIELFTAQIPNTDQPGVQLVPGGGTYQFRLKLMSGFSSTMQVRAIVERRDPGGETTGTLPLNVFLANGITPTAATAASDPFLQAVLARVDEILSQQGVHLGDVDYYDIANPGYDQVLSESEFNDLLETSSAATQTRLNLFFVQVALGGGVVGVSATITGPRLNGTPLSGVMSVYTGYTSNTIGLIAAHEIGHFLGLYHTVEQDGSHDFVVDTAECPASGTNSACSVPGGGYLMHWQAVGGTDVTDGQGLVIRGHPHVDPYEGGSPKIGKPAPITAADLSELLALPSGWCGTCRGDKHGRDE